MFFIPRCEKICGGTLMKLLDIQNQIQEKKIKLLSSLIDELSLEEKEAQLLKIISNYSYGDQEIDPVQFESELEKIGIKLFTKEWTETLGALHRKGFVKLNLKLNTKS